MQHLAEYLLCLCSRPSIDLVGMPEPPEGSEEIGNVPDYLRPLYDEFTSLQDEVTQIDNGLTAEMPSCVRKLRVEQVLAKRDLAETLEKVFWHEIRSMFGLWSFCTIGVTNHWVVWRHAAQAP